MPFIAWVAAIAVTAFAAAVQGSVGIGFAIISVPILSLIDPSLAPVPQMLVTMFLTIPMAWRERSHIEFDGIAWILAGRVPGALVGLGLLVVATQRTLDLATAALVLVAVVIIASGTHLRRTATTEFAAGVFSGAAALVSSIGGPPLALLYTDEERAGTVRASLAAVFTIGITISIVTRALGGFITANDIRVAVIIFPAVLVGYGLSGSLKERVGRRQLRFAILALSSIAALGLLVRAFS